MNTRRFVPLPTGNGARQYVARAQVRAPSSIARRRERVVVPATDELDAPHAPAEQQHTPETSR
jgi:hypothetical protein